jgi:hypothetical protein
VPQCTGWPLHATPSSCCGRAPACVWGEKGVIEGLGGLLGFCLIKRKVLGRWYLLGGVRGRAPVCFDMAGGRMYTRVLRHGWCGRRGWHHAR